MNKQQIEAAFSAARIAYDEGGECAVYERVTANQIPHDDWCRCPGCEYESPILDGRCLVCEWQIPKPGSGEQFNHAFTLAFTLVNGSPTGEGTTADELRHAIWARLESLSDEELIDHIGLPFDTFSCKE